MEKTMKHTKTFAAGLLRGAAVALLAAGPIALAAEEGAAVGGFSFAAPKKPAPKKIDPVGDSRGGVELSLASPVGDLGDAVKAGFGIGGFWELPFTARYFAGADDWTWIQLSAKWRF